MKILMVSMSSIHFFRWTEQLRGAGHKVYWIDVFDSGIKNPRIDFVEQTVGWRNRIDFPGRYLIKNRLPGLNSFINKFNQRKLVDIIEEKIDEIKPDVVHSFILQSGVLPLLDVMKGHPGIKWVYSAWGNDLFYRQQNSGDLKLIKKALPHLNYMFADCTRDYYLAKKYRFKGTYLGTYPTGGGYNLEQYKTYVQNFSEKKYIIIKGYEGKLGRCIKVLAAIKELRFDLSNFKILVFGANKNVEKYAKKTGILSWDNFELYFHIPQEKVLELMGKSKIYIGNNISDGLPNTLLEAIIMKCFPIQSNPGGATSELIANGKNGLLIEDPENVEKIRNAITKALGDSAFVKQAVEHNSKYIVPKLEREYIRNQVLEKYNFIAGKIKSADD